MTQAQFIQFTAEELAISIEEISLDMEFRNLSVWSSLNALLYISRVFDETSYLISTSDLVRLKTFGDIFNHLNSKLNGAL